MSQTYHTVGGIHVVTRAYPPDHLSSVRCVNSIGIGQGHNSVVWEPINYSDLYDPIPLTKSLSRIDRCFTNRKDNDIWGDWMRKPFISLPQDVSELDPTWTTCSGVAIGAMDPPRALVPAAGFEDPPPSVPADPPSSGPITQSAPSLPTATPGKTVPDPVPLPTPKPVKGTDPNLQPLPQPKPKDDPPTDPHDPSIDPQPEPPSPSPIVKSPSKSPAVAAPQPQEPSPNPPVVKPTGDNGEGSGDGLDVQPPTRGDRPGPEQPSDDRAKQPPANPDPLKSISAVLFPNPSPIVSSGKPGSDGVTGDQVPKGQQQQPTPSDQGGGSSPGGKDDSTPGQIQSDSQGTGSKPGSDHPTTVDAQDQSTAPKDQSNANGDSTVHDGGHSGFESKGQPQPEGSGNIDKSETSSGTGSASPNGSGNSEVVSKGDTSSPAKSPEVQFDSGPRTFAFVSNAPPPVVGSHTIARAPDGAAVVGTATIYPGEAQIVQGTPVSIAPDAIVVGSSTFAVTPPEKAETPAEAPVISQVPGGGLVVGSKTIMPGNQDSINGHEVSVGPSNVFVDGKSIAFPAMTPPPSIPLNIGGVQVSRGSGNRVVIGDSTYKPGAQLTVSGHTVSVGSGEVKIDGTAHSIPGTPAGSPLLVDGQSVFKASDSRVIVGTATLTPGSVTTVGGHAISIATNAVVIDQSTYALPAQPGVAKTPDTPGTPSAAPLTVGEHTISKAANGALIIGASTISPGNQVTIAGHTISAAPNRVIVDDTTYTLPAAAGAVQSPVAAASPITLANGIVVTPGASAITVASEKVISVFPDGKSFVIGGSTITVPTATPTAGESVFTVAGEVFTAAPTGFVIAGMTVSPGGAAVTVSGTVVSLGTVGLRVGSATFPLPTGTSTSTSTDELGDVIMSAFDAGPTTGGAGSADAPASTGVSGVEAFTSGAVRKAGGLKRTVFGLGVGVVVSVIGSFM
ncbi:MAG: hypothetical protein LQ346_008360 [Caloplaca aetnensis]|nr:MAG: hypothetical protein LQ346_008360 [Caloplaca aetnensis]